MWFILRQEKVKRRISSFASGFSTHVCIFHVLINTVSKVSSITSAAWIIRNSRYHACRLPGEYREKVRYHFFLFFIIWISRAAKLRAAKSWQNVSYEYENRKCKHVDTFYVHTNVFLMFSLLSCLELSELFAKVACKFAKRNEPELWVVLLSSSSAHILQYTTEIYAFLLIVI